MRKFQISADLSGVLQKQQTQLSVTTAVSALGLVLVAVVNAVSVVETDEPEQLDIPEGN